MTRIFFALVLLAMMLPVQAGEFWDRLWRNADQQGEALLQRGDASNAARVYADPRRKAYAKLQAGDYAGAAQELDKLHDSDADYNRGNALAHGGNLQGALDAYDAALKSDPDNKDARHNRELVANALKQQASQQQKSGGNKSQDDKKEGQQGKGSSDQNSSSNQDKGEGKDKQAEQSGKDKNDQQGKSGQADNKSGKGQDSAAQGKTEDKNKQERQGKEGEKPQDGKPENAKQAGQDKNGQQAKPGQTDNKAGKDQQAAAKDDAEQARRDAEASLAKPAADGKNGEAVGDEINAGKDIHATAPRSEQQIAQEQWLRSIPDDPGGLLRRKFMIQHMMRQQKAQQ